MKVTCITGNSKAKPAQLKVELSNQNPSRSFLITPRFYDTYNLELDLRFPSGHVVSNLCAINYRKMPPTTLLHPGEVVAQTVPFDANCYASAAVFAKARYAGPATLTARFTELRSTLGFDVVSNPIPVNVAAGAPAE
jgi:hypothetical protein